MADGYSRKTIGQINGPWAIMFRVMLATYPIIVGIVIAWLSWITVGQIKDDNFRALGDRFSREDYRQHLVEERAEHKAINTRFDLLPPADWRASRLKLEADVSALQNIVAENRNILVRIETKLESIK